MGWRSREWDCGQTFVPSRERTRKSATSGRKMAIGLKRQKAARMRIGGLLDVSSSPLVPFIPYCGRPEDREERQCSYQGMHWSTQGKRQRLSHECTGAHKAKGSVLATAVEHTRQRQCSYRGTPHRSGSTGPRPPASRKERQCLWAAKAVEHTRQRQCVYHLAVLWVCSGDVAVHRGGPAPVGPAAAAGAGGR